MFIFDEPLALLELRLTAAILRGGLNGVVFGDTTELTVGCGMVVVMAVFELIRAEGAGGVSSFLLMLASPSIEIINSCPEKDGSTSVSSEES